MMLNRITNIKLAKTLKRVIPSPQQVVSILSSPKTVAILKVGVAIVTLGQALDMYKDTKRKIGFKVK